MLCKALDEPLVHTARGSVKGNSVGIGWATQIANFNVLAANTNRRLYDSDGFIEAPVESRSKGSIAKCHVHSLGPAK